MILGGVRFRKPRIPLSGPGLRDPEPQCEDACEGATARGRVSPPASGQRDRGLAQSVFNLGRLLAVSAMAVCALTASFEGSARASDSMSFHVAPLETGNCGARCPHVIVAEGVIEADTPQTFVDFLRSASDDRKLKRIVFFDSRGGNVVASMVFGHILRELRVAGIVGRFERGDAGPFVGECLSACVYAMMGAIRRVAPEGSQVALHRMSIVEHEGGGWGGPAHVTRSFADKPMVSILKRYARRMGVDPKLVALAESLPPDSMRELTPAEMRRWSFATGRF